MKKLKKDQILKVFPLITSFGKPKYKVKFYQKPSFYCLTEGGNISTKALESKYFYAILIRQYHPKWEDKNIDDDRLISIETADFDHHRGTLNLFKNNLIDGIPILICKNAEDGRRIGQSIYYVKTMSRFQIVLKEIF
jgi:hypothetical protein